MRYARGWAAILAVLLGASAAWGQFWPGYGGGFAAGGNVGLSFGRVRGNKSLSFSLNASWSRYRGYGYSAFGPPYGGFYGYGGPPVTYLSIVAPPPPPPIIIFNPPPPPREPEIVFVEVGRRPDPAPAPEAPLPGEAAGRFRPLGPGDRDRARQPAPDAKREAKPKVERPAEPLPPPGPEADPQREYERLLMLGQEAFAVQERGRALHRFRQAVALRPGEPVGQALLAQTLFSLGKYAEAVETIHTLMQLDPNWENTKFRPLELYGPNPADWSENLRTLEEALKASPEEPVLLFLYAHQLWLDGRQDEALPLFQKAARFAPEKDKPFINRFLKGRPPRGPVV